MAFDSRAFCTFIWIYSGNFPKRYVFADFFFPKSKEFLKCETLKFSLIQFSAFVILASIFPKPTTFFFRILSPSAFLSSRAQNEREKPFLMVKKTKSLINEMHQTSKFKRHKYLVSLCVSCWRKRTAIVSKRLIKCIRLTEKDGEKHTQAIHFILFSQEWS